MSTIGDFEKWRYSKRREGDILGDGNFSGITKMGITLKEDFPFHL